jgi:hypothetical protein
MHNVGHPFVPVEHGRYLAQHIKGAKYIKVSSSGAQLEYDRVNEAVDAITEFLTGDRPSVPVDRVLTTILFTDIVQSTERAVSLGDRRWRSLLDAPDRAVREQLRRFREREIKTTGDRCAVLLVTYAGSTISPNSGILSPRGCAPPRPVIAMFVGAVTDER